MAAPFALGNAAQYSLQLLRGQMISEMVTEQLSGPASARSGASGSGISLREYILGKTEQPRPGEASLNPGSTLNGALVGVLADDAAKLRQASKNLGQGVKISRRASSALANTQDKVRRMREIVAALGDPSLSASEKVALRVEYNGLSRQIAEEVQNTEYQGTKLLDGESWAENPAVTPGENNDSGTLTLQGGPEETKLTLYNITPYTNFTPGDTDEGALTATAQMLAEADSLFGTMRESYEARAGLYAAEAASYERQADLLDEAGQRARPGDAQNLREKLLELMTSEQGQLLNAQS